jgi:hypothetical protein
MSWTNWKGLVASSALVAALTVVVAACSSSSGGPVTTPSDAGDASHPVVQHKDAGFDSGTGDDSGEAGTAAPAFDGTSGQICASNADCKGTAAGSPGNNVCSNSYNGLLNTVNGVTRPQLWPTPLCMMPLPTVAGVGNCDPGDQGFLQFCDSADPTNPASPGICLPLTNPQQAGPTNGICLPGCSFALDGSAPVGCPGKDTCVPDTFLLDATGAAIGFGFCQGTCETDADCSALGTGWGCQTDIGFCTQTKKTRTKAIGTACTNAGNGAAPIAASDSQTGSCDCPFSGSSVTAFYCTSACVVGGNPCPDGWICDAFEPEQLIFTDQTGAQTIVAGPTVQNVGLPGTCIAPCAGPDGGAGEAGVDGGSLECPALSTCTAPTDTNGTVAGPDCQPM